MSTELLRQSESAYLDFVSAVRLYSLKNISPKMRQHYRDTASAGPVGPSAAALSEAHTILDGEPMAQTYKRVTRTTQEMNWRTVVNSGPEIAERLESEMRAAEVAVPGRLLLDPNLVYPDYFKTVDFHIQPGGYAGSPLSGYFYYLGAGTFQKGLTGQPAQENKRMFVNAVPVPSDGRVSRALDLACGIGWSTWPLKERFPGAEIWGADISAPMVRFAHKLAVERGQEIYYAQMAAEALRFPDRHFDLVHAHILFHEIPLDIARRVIAEAFRVLRPGGVFAISDFRSSRAWTGIDAYVREFDQEDNGEPYSSDFCHFDVLGALRDAGFTDVREVDIQNQTLRSGVRV